MHKVLIKFRETSRPPNGQTILKHQSKSKNKKESYKKFVSSSLTGPPTNLTLHEIFFRKLYWNIRTLQENI